MLAALKSFGLGLARRWWALVVGGLGGLASLAENLGNDPVAPPGVWAAVMVLAIVVAAFLAYHDLWRELDSLRRAVAEVRPRRVDVVKERLVEIKKLASAYRYRQFPGRGFVAQTLWAHVYSILIKSTKTRRIADSFDAGLKAAGVQRGEIGTIEQLPSVIDKVFDLLVAGVDSVIVELEEVHLQEDFLPSMLPCQKSREDLCLATAEAVLAHYSRCARSIYMNRRELRDGPLFDEARAAVKTLLLNGDLGMPRPVPGLGTQEVLEQLNKLHQWLDAQRQGLTLHDIRPEYRRNFDEGTNPTTTDSSLRASAP